MTKIIDLKKHVPTFPGFPKEGINFYDVTGLFRDPDIFAITNNEMTRLISTYQPTRLFAIDSKGFIFASPVAHRLGIGLSLIRKKSKLPGNPVSYKYELEYGFDEIEARAMDFDIGDRIVIIDDVLATGGTLAAAVALIQQLKGNVVGAVTAMELLNLKGRDKLKIPFSAMLAYES